MIREPSFVFNEVNINANESSTILDPHDIQDVQKRSNPHGNIA